MRNSLLVAFGLACLSGTAFAQTIETDMRFDRYFGDASAVEVATGNPPMFQPLPFPLDVYINVSLNGGPRSENFKVMPYDPPVRVEYKDVNGNPQDRVLQGELGIAAFEEGMDSVEFLIGQTVGTQTTFLPSTRISWTPTVVGAPANLHDTFLFGTLTITNGVAVHVANFDVRFTTSSGDPRFNHFSFTDVIQYVSKSDPSGDDFANADVVTFLGHPGLGSLHVFESGSAFDDTGAVQLWGRIGSLEPLFFVNATGGVAISEPAVPEPSQWAQMLAGLVAIVHLARARRGRQPL